MFTTKIYLNSCHLRFPNNFAVKKALQTRSFKIFATRTRQEITKRENSSSKKAQCIKNLIVHTAENIKLCFHRHRAFKFSSKKVYLREIIKNPCSGQKHFHSKPLTNGQMTYKFKKHILTKTN